MRRLVGSVVAVGGPLLLVRRRRAARRDRVRLHFDDGSTVSLESGAPAADRFLALARRAL